MLKPGIDSSFLSKISGKRQVLYSGILLCQLFYNSQRPVFGTIVYKNHFYLKFRKFFRNFTKFFVKVGQNFFFVITRNYQ